MMDLIRICLYLCYEFSVRKPSSEICGLHHNDFLNEVEANSLVHDESSGR